MKARYLLIVAANASLMLPLTLCSQTKPTNPAAAPPPAHTKNITPLQGVKYQPLDIKTGLWEKTATYKNTGHMAVPAAMLDKLTPEQRARYEARMNARAAGNSHTTTDKLCITAQQLNDPTDLVDKGCTVTILESSSSKSTGTISCKIQGMQMNGNADFEAIDQEHFKGTEHATSSGEGNQMIVDATFTSKWLGASCGNVQ